MIEYEHVTITTTNKEVARLDVDNEAALMEIFKSGAWVELEGKRVYYPPQSIVRATVVPVSGD